MQEYHNEFAIHWYHNASHMEKAGGLHLIRAGRNHAKSNYKIGPRFIVYYSLHFVLKGSVIFRYRDHQKMLVEGELFCQFPHETYTYQIADENQPLEMAWIAFYGKQAPLLLNQIGLTDAQPWLPNKSIHFKQILEPLFHYFESSHQTCLDLTQILYTLFQQLMDFYPQHGIQPEQGDWMQKAIDYMKLHYTEIINIADIAANAGVSRFHFSKAFSKKMGCPPIQYLQKLRMTKAAEMLLETDHAVKQIAYSLGYSELFAFSRAFRNYYGIPPSRYSERSKKQTE